MDILKNTDAMGKRIFADLEKINFIRTSTSAEETRAANIIKDELAKEGMEAVIEEFMVETADIHKVSLKALGKEWEIKGYRRSGSTPPEGLTAEFAYVQQGNDIDLYDKKGKIVLVNSGRLNEEVYEKLVRYGVAGFLTWNGNVSDVREDTDLGERELRYWALRYGTIPIVRETGGLKDTVHAFVDYAGTGNGFSFASYNAHDMLHVIREACGVFRFNKPAWSKLIMQGMQSDFSWGSSADKYIEVYKTAMGQ